MFSQTTDLIISKYGEGTSNHKFLEIYNGTGSDIDLSTYAFPNSNNAPATPGEYEYWNSFTAGAVIAAGDVYVITHGSADATLLAEADQHHTYLSNGDDGFKLVKDWTWNDADSDGDIDVGEATGFTVVDVLGDWQADPGSGWDVAGVSSATANHTLTRKTSVCSGNTDWASSAGTDANDSEWVVTGSNEGWDTVGSYTTACVSSVAETIPWSDSFETSGLTEWTNDANYPWKEGLAASYEAPPSAVQDGSSAVYFDDYSYSTGSSGTITSPLLDLTSATAPQLTFYYADNAATGNGDTVEVVLGDGTVIYTTPAETTDWELQTVDLTAYVGQTITIGFKGTSVYGYSNPHVDNVMVAEPSADASADWSVSTSGTDVTLSISVTNFTLSSDGSGDGHWHYTIDGSSPTMWYSTNDVYLGLGNDGEHTIVAWLVDNNHDPLNPAVEETITFSTFDGTYGGTYPYCSSFDADLDNWTAESVSGDANWSSASANQNSTVTPYSGAGMAYMYDNSSVANLISPSMDLSAVANPQVTFSHTQVEWAGDQDELRVWYKAASGDAWTELAAYTAEVTAWTEVTLDLPNPSADYYVAFNGTAGYGRGMTIDDVCVHAGPVTYESIPWYNDLEGDLSEFTTYQASSGSGMWDITTSRYNSGAQSVYHDDTSGSHDSWLLTPTFDLSGATAPELKYWDNENYASYYDNHEVLVSEDYTDDVAAATWVELADGVSDEDTWVERGPLALPTTGTVTVAFRYVGDYADEWYLDDISVAEDTWSVDDVDPLDMRIYPNPVDGNFVTILSPVNGIKYVQVFDINGRMVMDTSINNNTLDVSSINSGFYMIKVTIDGQSKISKLVVR